MYIAPPRQKNQSPQSSFTFNDFECKHPSERIHKKLIWSVLGVHNKRAIDAIYGETGRFPFYLEKTIRMCKYYNKTFTNKKSPFAKMALMESRNLHSIGITTWFSTLACLTDKYNIQTDKEIDIPLTTSTLQATYKDKWLERINTSEKLRTYRTFKPTHKRDPDSNTTWTQCQQRSATSASFCQCWANVLPYYPS